MLKSNIKNVNSFRQQSDFLAANYLHPTKLLNSNYTSYRNFFYFRGDSGPTPEETQAMWKELFRSRGFFFGLLFFPIFYFSIKYYNIKNLPDIFYFIYTIFLMFTNLPILKSYFQRIGNGSDLFLTSNFYFLGLFIYFFLLFLNVDYSPLYKFIDDSFSQFFLTPLIFSSSQVFFEPMLVSDVYSWISRIVLVIFAVYHFFFARRFLVRMTTEIFSLLSFMNLICFFLCSVNNLLILFLLFELMTFTLVGLSSIPGSREIIDDKQFLDVKSSLVKFISLEASLKYLLNSAFSILFFLLGLLFLLMDERITLFFTDYKILIFLIDSIEFPNLNITLTQVGLILIFLSFLFKLSVYPFHMWFPDILQGASFAVSFFYSTVVKLALLMAYFRFYICYAPIVSELYLYVSFIFGILSLVMGAVYAFRQTHVTRFFSFVSVSSTGLVILSTSIISPTVSYYYYFYVFTFVMNTMLFFAFVGIASTKNEPLQHFNSFADLFAVKSNCISPLFKYFFAFVLFSLAGVPPFVGFFPKLAILNYLFSGYNFYMSLIFFVSLVISSLLLAYYFLNIIITFFSEKNASDQVLIPYYVNPKAYQYILFAYSFLIFFYPLWEVLTLSFSSQTQKMFISQHLPYLFYSVFHEDKVLYSTLVAYTEGPSIDVSSFSFEYPRLVNHLLFFRNSFDFIDCADLSNFSSIIEILFRISNISSKIFNCYEMEKSFLEPVYKEIKQKDNTIANAALLKLYMINIDANIWIDIACDLCQVYAKSGVILRCEIPDPTEFFGKGDKISLDRKKYLETQDAVRIRLFFIAKELNMTLLENMTDLEFFKMMRGTAQSYLTSNYFNPYNKKLTTLAEKVIKYCNAQEKNNVPTKNPVFYFKVPLTVSWAMIVDFKRYFTFFRFLRSSLSSGSIALFQIMDYYSSYSNSVFKQFIGHYCYKIVWFSHYARTQEITIFQSIYYELIYDKTVVNRFLEFYKKLQIDMLDEPLRGKGSTRFPSRGKDLKEFSDYLARELKPVVPPRPPRKL